MLPNGPWNESTPIVIIGPYMNTMKIRKKPNSTGFDLLIGKNTIAEKGITNSTRAMRYQI